MMEIDNVYIWFKHDPHAILISRGRTTEEALKNLREEKSIDYYRVETWDGYHSSPDIVLYGDLEAEFGEYADKAREFRNVRERNSVILRIDTEVKVV